MKQTGWAQNTLKVVLRKPQQFIPFPSHCSSPRGTQEPLLGQPHRHHHHRFNPLGFSHSKPKLALNSGEIAANYTGIHHREKNNILSICTFQLMMRRLGDCEGAFIRMYVSCVNVLTLLLSRCTNTFSTTPPTNTRNPPVRSSSFHLVLTIGGTD